MTGHGRIDVRTIKTMPRRSGSCPVADVKQVFLVERYSYARTGSCSRGRRPRHHQPPAGQAVLTCSLTCAATGPSRCTIMSVMSCSGDASRTRSAYRHAAVRNAVAASPPAPVRTSLPSSAPITATLQLPIQLLA